MVCGKKAQTPKGDNTRRVGKKCQFRVWIMDFKSLTYQKLKTEVHGPCTRYVVLLCQGCVNDGRFFTFLFTGPLTLILDLLPLTTSEHQCFSLLTADALVVKCKAAVV